MSEADTRPAPRRPSTARPREEVDDHATAQPTLAELDAIERLHAAVLHYAGAEIVDDPEVGVVWIRYTGRTTSLSFAKCVRWPDDVAEERFDDLAQRMRSAGDWPTISLAEGVSQPARLLSLVEQLGWIKVAGERMMFTRHAPVVPHLDPGLRIEAVTPGTAAELVGLETANFGLPPDDHGERAERLAEAVANSAVRGFIVRLVAEPVAGARLVQGPAGTGISALTGVGVTARLRGRGYGRLVTAVATRAGLATGHGLVWLSVDEANTAAVKLYESLGYEPTFAWSRWLAPAD